MRLKHSLLAVLAITFSFLASHTQAWDLEHDEDGIKVYTEEIKGSSFKAFRGETTIRSSLHNLMAHHTDIKSMEDWLQDCDKSELVKRVSNQDFYIYQRTDAPWPVTDRDYMLHAKITQNPTDYAVTMTFEATTELTKTDDECVQVTQLTGYWRFTPKADGTIYIEYETHADPSGDLPAWLANSFVVDQPLGSLAKLRQRVENNKYTLPEEMAFIVEPAWPIANHQVLNQNTDSDNASALHDNSQNNSAN